MVIYSSLSAKRPSADIIISRKKILAAFLLTGVLLLLAAGCGSSTENISTAPTFGAYTATTSGPINKDGVVQLITTNLGKTTEGGGPLIRDVSVTPAAGGIAIKMDINRTPCTEIGTEPFCNSGQLPSIAVEASTYLMVSLFRYDNVASAELDLYGTSLQPQDADKLAVKVVFTRDAANKVDWSKVTTKNVTQFASDYWVDPSVVQSEKDLAAAAAKAGLTPDQLMHKSP